MKRPIFAWLLIAIVAPAMHAAPDVDVGWISRFPRVDYVEAPTDPRRDGWPAIGQIVTWRAHVKNWSSAPVTGVTYEWRLDGAVIGSGAFDAGANEMVTIDLAWPWDFTRRELEFVADRAQQVSESEEKNNRLLVYTDAISVGLYVEQSVYDYFHAKQAELKVGSNSFEDFAQRQISFLHEMYRNAISLETPHGVLDRWRIDEIVVVPDGALPLTGSHDTANVPLGPASSAPNDDDKTVDVIWGYPAAMMNMLYGPSARLDLFNIDRIALHEWSHIRTLVDNYRFFVRHDGRSAFVDILENGQPVVGTKLMPYRRSVSTLHAVVLYETIEDGLMTLDKPFLDRYSAGALNRIAGFRARGLFGNRLANVTLGLFMEDLAPRHRFRLVGPDGVPLSGADVRYYRSAGHADATRYLNEPDFQRTADANGELVIEGDPIRKANAPFVAFADGTRRKDFVTGISILRVEHQGSVHYLFFEVTAANRAYWRGETEESRYELVVGASPCAKKPELLTPSTGALIKPGDVTLSWTKTPGAAGYLVFASIDGRPARVIAVSKSTQATVRVEEGSVQWWVQAQFDQCISSTSEKQQLDVRTAVRRRSVR